MSACQLLPNFLAYYNISYFLLYFGHLPLHFICFSTSACQHVQAHMTNTICYVGHVSMSACQKGLCPLSLHKNIASAHRHIDMVTCYCADMLTCQHAGNITLCRYVCQMQLLALQLHS